MWCIIVLQLQIEQYPIVKVCLIVALGVLLKVPTATCLYFPACQSPLHCLFKRIYKIFHSYIFPIKSILIVNDLFLLVLLYILYVYICIIVPVNFNFLVYKFVFPHVPSASSFPSFKQLIVQVLFVSFLNCNALEEIKIQSTCYFSLSSLSQVYADSLLILSVILNDC